MNTAHTEPLCFPPMNATTAQTDGKRAIMINTRLTILYERLSREDERENESVSIENQKSFLEDYATRNGFTNIVHLADDGYSGTRWDRPSYLKMIEEVGRGNVAVVIVKDMSRIGRDHLRVGLLLEQLREGGVRFIAVNDNVDTDKGMDDFTPFRNIMNEWVARDTSRKIRAVNASRTKEGKRVTGAVPYGYLHDPSDRQKWILDETAAPVVAWIFKCIIDGKTVAWIADELKARNILIPSAHWEKIGAGMRKHQTADPMGWTATTIIAITKKQEYMGWKVLNKTVTETHKSKRVANDPENMLVFKDAHPQIVDEETWNIVQRLRGTRRRVYKLDGEPNPMTGILYCADCGEKMYHKKGSSGRENQPHHEYVCSSYRHYSRSCTCHYIRVPVIENIILNAIRRVSGYVRENETEFIGRVRETSLLQMEISVKENRKNLNQLKHRREKVGGLVKRLYESYATDKISEKNFTELMKGYDTEMETLDREIKELQTAVDNYNTNSIKADKFVDLVKQHTEFTKLTPTILNEFVEKVIVHEAVKVNGKREQRIDIHLNFIGNFQPPENEEAKPQEEPPKKKGRHKLRCEMTEEEIAHERELDRIYYNKKVADKKATAEKERLEILKGTSYEIKPKRAKIAS